MFAFNMEKYIRRTLTDCTDKTLFLFALNRLFEEVLAEMRKKAAMESFSSVGARNTEIRKYEMRKKAKYGQEIGAGIT